MAPKVKCPSCGAKNDVQTRRCRVCSTIINANVEAPAPPEPAAPVAEPDSFDMDVINRQVRSPKEMFKSSGGGLSARIAAAQGGAPAPSTSGPAPDPAGDPFGDSFGGPAAHAAPSAPPPLPAEDDFEPFDPDALFRDQG